MPTYKTRKIASSLNKKGFVQKKGKSKHIKYTLYVNGKKTRVYTWISHGKDEYGDQLLNAMRKELYLNKPQELEDLIECPMTEEALISLLIKRKVVIV
jgi:predicted RNA binding protein YcfA (HicA-like mRNA interferase family)